MCLAQGHSTVTPVRLELEAPRSRVKHSTTEPLCSLLSIFEWPFYTGFTVQCLKFTNLYNICLCLFSQGSSKRERGKSEHL